MDKPQKKFDGFDAFKMELASDITADIKDYTTGEVTSRKSGQSVRVARKIIENMQSHNED